VDRPHVGTTASQRVTTRHLLDEANPYCNLEQHENEEVESRAASVGRSPHDHRSVAVAAMEARVRRDTHFRQVGGKEVRSAIGAWRALRFALTANIVNVTEEQFINSLL
jgi:hypothetical protein